MVMDVGPALLEPGTARHVRGRKCWVPLWILTFVSLYVAVLAMTACRWSGDGLCARSVWNVTRMYVCTFAAPLAWLGYLWWSTASETEVPLGLLVSVWFWAGTISVGCCSICNWAMVKFWVFLDPRCFITHPADNWPWDHTSLRCALVNVFQWVVTAGMIEEHFKFACLLRLQPSRARILVCINQGPCCSLPGLPPGWWLKLAESQLAVALCGIAAGAGLATSENFMYIFSQESIDRAFGENDLESAYGRIAASFAHMVWTGYAACGLARWQFRDPLEAGRPTRRTSFLLAPVVLHGLYNWCSTLQRCEAYEEVYEGQLYQTDGCYLPQHLRSLFRVGHVVVMLVSFYWWHVEFSEILAEYDRAAAELEVDGPKGGEQ